MIQTKSKIKPDLRLSDDFLNLEKGSNVLIEQIEETIKMREMPIEQQLRRQMKNKVLTRD